VVDDDDDDDDGGDSEHMLRRSDNWSEKQVLLPVLVPSHAGYLPSTRKMLTLEALTSFQYSMARPADEDARTTHDVSLSSRYSKMTWGNGGQQ